VGDRNNYRNSLLFDFHKTTDLTEESLEDFLEVEDSLEEEDSPEVEDTREEEEYHQGDHQEAVGDHHRYPCHRHIKENW